MEDLSNDEIKEKKFSLSNFELKHSKVSDSKSRDTASFGNFGGSTFGKPDKIGIGNRPQSYESSDYKNFLSNHPLL